MIEGGVVTREQLRAVLSAVGPGGGERLGWYTRGGLFVDRGHGGGSPRLWFGVFAA